MAMPFLPAQLERFRREAKKLVREFSITHSEALDRIAVKNGFTNWSLLVKHSSGPSAPVIALPATPARTSGSIRYYLHGDVVEDDPTQCYCARCDLFRPLTHLVPTSYHPDGKDGERFLSSLASWQTSEAAERGRDVRPDGAPNILEAPARAERAAREAARSPFHRWLEGQRRRNDPVGDLAGDVLGDEGFPLGASTRREVEDYLEGYGSHVIRAVRQAWREFENDEPARDAPGRGAGTELKVTVLAPVQS